MYAKINVEKSFSKEKLKMHERTYQSCWNLQYLK